MRTNVLRIPESPNDLISICVRGLRERRVLTQAALAKRLGWSQTRYSKLEMGDQAWTVVDLWQVANAFGLRASELVGRAQRKAATARKGPARK